MAHVTVVLRGGSRDGESTVLDEAVTRLVAVSEAPGLLDVYQASDEVEEVASNPEPARVFNFTGQEPADGWAPEAIHMQAPGQ